MNKNPKKSDQKVIKPKFEFKSSSKQEIWSSWWFSRPHGVEAVTGLNVAYASKYVFHPNTGYLIPQPNPGRVIDPERNDLWFMYCWQDQESRKHYSPTLWKKDPKLRKYVSPHTKLHRKFASIPFDPDAMIEFINHFGFLGSHGVYASNERYSLIYAESYEDWCVQIHLVWLLVKWWDLLQKRSESSRRELAKWFDVSGNSGNVLQESIKLLEIPDHLEFRLESEKTTSNLITEAPGLKMKSISVPYATALDPRKRLTKFTESWVDENGFSVRGKGETKGARLQIYEEAQDSPDIFEVASIVIGEWVNRVLSDTTRVAIHLERSGSPVPSYHLIAENLLGAIYHSLCQEILGKRDSKRVCLQCRSAFTPGRIDQKYCSSRCRQVSAHRRSRKRSKVAANPLTAKSTAKPTPGQQKSPSQGAF
jgi:hypothetical protein